MGNNSNVVISTFALLVLIFSVNISEAGTKKASTKNKQEAVQEKVSIKTSQSIEVKNERIRLTPPTSKNSAAFMEIVNKDSVDHKLMEVKASISKYVELHTHVQEDGMMKMRQVPEFVLPASGTLELKPGSFHIMFIQLNEPLKESQEVDLTLVFEDKSEKSVKVKVVDLNPK